MTAFTSIEQVKLHSVVRTVEYTTFERIGVVVGFKEDRVKVVFFARDKASAVYFLMVENLEPVA